MNDSFLTKELFKIGHLEIALVNFIAIGLAIALYYIFLIYFRRRLRRLVPDQFTEVQGNKIPLYKIFRQTLVLIGLVLVVLSFEINNSFSFGEFMHISLYPGKQGGFHIDVSHIIWLIVAVYLTRIVISLLRFILNKRAETRPDLNEGSVYVIVQMGRYLIYIVVFVSFIQSTGANVTLLLTSSAALLVGIGFALQDFLKDVFSGIVLLLDGSIRVGDMIVITNPESNDTTFEIARVEKIGLRTSKVINRDNIVIILPNNYVTSNRVSNWTNEGLTSRFKAPFSVAYGTKLEDVQQLLEPELIKFDFVRSVPKPFIKLENMGANGLELKYIFWSDDVWHYDLHQGKINARIYALLQENNIEIPFPQLTLHKGKGDF